jgi:hippurate hydrolase
MKRGALSGAVFFLGACAAGAPQARPERAPLSAGRGDAIHEPLRRAVEAELPGLVELYKWFHRNPELSLQETKTAARLAAELRGAGWEVTENVGGTGVVGVLRNGPGPVVLARVDMDALPVKEETGLPYASAASGVMHACGHDSHMAIGVGLARVLAALRDRWSGTAVLVGQPAEEVGRGALQMLEDPRFHRAVPGRPVACLSVHNGVDPAGTVAVCPGFASANVDSIDIVIRGRGGHGAWPHRTVDPIVIGAEIVLALQTIVSRKLPPGTRAVVTVGAFHAGTKHNIIPDEARLQLTVRSYEDEVREKLRSEIEHIAREVGEAHRVPVPVEVKETDVFTPAGYHDPELSERMHDVFSRLLGPDRVLRGEPSMGGEDFSRFPRHYGVPGLQFRVGGAPPSHDPSIGLHSSKWAVDPEPTIRTGTLALSRAMLELLAPRP